MEEKIIELEKRVKKLEDSEKKRKRNKIISTVLTLVLALIIGIAYAIIISNIYGNYTGF